MHPEKKKFGSELKVLVDEDLEQLKVVVIKIKKLAEMLTRFLSNLTAKGC